jgi:molecular chaperone HscB
VRALNGVDLQTESNTAMPMAFLMQQMEWREALGEARAGSDLDALEALDAEVKADRKARLAQIGAAAWTPATSPPAAQGVRR